MWRWRIQDGTELKINVQKCQTVLYQLGPRLPDLDIRIRGTTVPPANSFRYLGVELDRSLTFNSHYQSTTEERKRVNLLKMLAGTDCLSQDTTHFHSFSHPVTSRLLLHYLGTLCPLSTDWQSHLWSYKYYYGSSQTHQSLSSTTSSKSRNTAAKESHQVQVDSGCLCQPSRSSSLAASCYCWHCNLAFQT